MDSWQGIQPCLYNVVTGFFPEASPKDSWETNPRPLLICGVAADEKTGLFFCRVAYGTSQRISQAKDTDLVVGNITELNNLGLKKATRFVINSGRHMVILPWTEEFFRPWTGYKTPILSCLPEPMQRFVGYTLSGLDDLPQF